MGGYSAKSQPFDSTFQLLDTEAILLAASRQVLLCPLSEALSPKYLLLYPVLLLNS